MKYLNDNGLLYLVQKIKTWLNNKVDKVNGKGLSTNDYTTEEKNKLSGIDTGATKTTVENVLTSTSTTNALSAYQGKALNDKISAIEVPTNNNQLENGAGYITGITGQMVRQALTYNPYSDANPRNYQTKSEVEYTVSEAIKNIQGISYSVVTSLPSTGEAGVIYLISNSGSNPNIYDEYIYINDKFEKIGTTAVDLTNYVTNDDLEAITNAEIDTIVGV